MKPNEVISCILCGRGTNGLGMYAQRNDKDRIVGWVFVCPNCEDKIKNKLLDVELSAKPIFKDNTDITLDKAVEELNKFGIESGGWKKSDE